MNTKGEISRFLCSIGEAIHLFLSAQTAVLFTSVTNAALLLLITKTDRSHSATIAVLLPVLQPYVLVAKEHRSPL